MESDYTISDGVDIVGFCRLERAELVLRVQTCGLVDKLLGREMVGGKMPMMTFILASGYLFVVYLLLALAKRGTSKIPPRQTQSISSDELAAEVSMNGNITEIVSGQ